MFRTPKGSFRLAIVAAAGALALAACSSSTAAETPSTVPSSGSAAGLACPAGSLTAEGSTAQKNAFEEIMASYGQSCANKATLNYNATGSGAGIKAFYNNQVDFAGSDSALKDKENDGIVETAKAKQRCGGNEAWNLPMVVGPVAFAYHLDGIDTLVLNAEVLAKIFSGSITTWNDPAIAALNPTAQLPADTITVFFRSDESGTTENVTTFLKAAGNSAWAHEPGKAWTGKGEGKNKSSGIADALKSTKGSISYIEWSYALDNSLPMARLDNGSGPVELTGENVAKAVGAAKVSGTGHDLKLDLDYATNEEGAYPAVLVTYEIVCSKGLDPAKTAIEKDFLTYFADAETQKSLEELGYAPLPADLATKVTAAIAAIS